jgi:hypothetical protein
VGILDGVDDGPRPEPYSPSKEKGTEVVCVNTGFVADAGRLGDGLGRVDVVNTDVAAGLGVCAKFGRSTSMACPDAGDIGILNRPS